MSWTYEGKCISSLQQMPSKTVGFVYELTHLPTGKKYIGKKILHFKKVLPPLKGKKRRRRSVVESDWKDYYGSHSELKQIVKESVNPSSLFKREILQYCYNKKQMTYYETKWQMLKNVLIDDTYFNQTVAGKFYKKDLVV